MTRYQQLLEIIDRDQPSFLVEVGAWNGDRAIALLKQARRHQPSVDYYGFDLFEDATATTDTAELNVKPHFSRAEVERRIAQALAEVGGAKVRLIKGNTRRTLWPLAPDLAFIDGGHSLETITGDFERLAGAKTIVLDDFYESDDLGRCPDISRWGCNELVVRLAIEGRWHIRVLPRRDPVMGGGYVKMVEVRRR